MGVILISRDKGRGGTSKQKQNEERYKDEARRMYSENSEACSLTESYGMSKTDIQEEKWTDMVRTCWREPFMLSQEIFT